jgi:thiamine-phosphate pyrophosphorylase
MTMAVPAPSPRLIAITDLTRAGAERSLARYERLVRAARPGSVVLMLREPGLGGAERLAFGRALVRLAHEHQQLFQVNDRLDFAALLAADALHLGEASVSVSDARRIVGPRAFVTRACHEPERAGELGVDGVLLSPILEARKGRPALGLSGLERARRALEASGDAALLFALGGVDARSAKSCLDAGADGVAAIGAVLFEPEPEALLAALGSAR